MNKLPFAIIGIAVIVLAFFLYQEAGQQELVSAAHVYEHEGYGISFTSPEGYVLSEQELGGPEHEHHVITLVRAEDATPREGGEGPTGITVEMYQNGYDPHTLIQWLTAYSIYSNFGLGDGTYASTTVAGLEAVRYHWSGLYEGETTAFTHEHWMVLVTVTRLNPDDHTQAYQEVLESLELQ